MSERTKEDVYQSVLLALSLLELPARDDFDISKTDLIGAARAVLMREMQLYNGLNASIPSQKTAEIIALLQTSVVIGKLGNV